MFASAVFSAASIVSFSFCSQVTSKPCKQHRGLFFFLFCVDYYPFILKGHWVSAEEIYHLALSVFSVWSDLPVCFINGGLSTNKLKIS